MVSALLLVICAIAVLPLGALAVQAIRVSNDPILDLVPRLVLGLVAIGSMVVLLFVLFAGNLLIERLLGS